MTSPHTPGIAAGRLDAEEIASNFADLHPAYDPHEAAVAADRCYFCHDAPCITACPTDIDIPLFVRQISTGQPEAAAQTIFEQNILGGMCARVCPTETLCEEACVREAAEGKPVEIGRLQRFATDAAMTRQGHPFERAPATGKSIGVVGSGPAGLACAHRLAMKGHDVTIYEARARAGGLNEYGLAAYKTTDNFAAREIDWLLGIGGITVVHGKTLGDNLDLAALQDAHDAVFLGIGLAGVNRLDLPGFDLPGVRNAVDFIAELRQADDKSAVPVGRNVVVIGGGMTAIDAAVQSRLLGAETVTLAYRRSRADMGASGFEQNLAATHGVRIMTNVTPVAVHGDGAAQEIELQHTQVTNGSVQASGERLRLPVDQVLLAIGQTLTQDAGLVTERGKITVSATGRTSLAGVWAGGDCTPGDDLTVVAVAEGRDAAEDIHAALS